MILVTRFRIGFPLATWWWLKKEFVLHSPSIRLFNPNSIWTTFVWVLRQSISKSFVQDTARPSFAVSLHGKGKIRTTLSRPHRERGYLRFYWFRTARVKGKWVSVFYPPNSGRDCQSSVITRLKFHPFVGFPDHTLTWHLRSLSQFGIRSLAQVFACLAVKEGFW